MPTFMQKWLVILCLYMFHEVAEGLLLEYIRGQKSNTFRQEPVLQTMDQASITLNNIVLCRLDKNNPGLLLETVTFCRVI